VRNTISKWRRIVLTSGSTGVLDDKESIENNVLRLFKSEGLEYRQASYAPSYITVIYERNNYRIQLDTKRNKG
jgi:hypothetical protein